MWGKKSKAAEPHKSDKQQIAAVKERLDEVEYRVDFLTYQMKVMQRQEGEDAK